MPYLDQAPAPKNARIIHYLGQNFEQLRQECLRNRTLFEDPEFPADSSSLYGSKEPKSPVMWKRPKEIVKNPKFILGGATRTDICQGKFGDCWLLAAIASLTLNEKALARVVPQDQNFDSGIFHFRLWQSQGKKWEDVVIDDRLPTSSDRLIYLHSADNNKFWGALLEKAYVKWERSSKAPAKNGKTEAAMEALTGGSVETFTTEKPPENFYKTLKKALERGSLMVCTTKEKPADEDKTPLGHKERHAYTVTKIDQVNSGGQKTELIRVRNPWGESEWNGAWSDSSPEWSSVDDAEKNRLCHPSPDKGEFWMAFAHIKDHFDEVKICCLTPDALEEDALRKWDMDGNVDIALPEPQQPTSPARETEEEQRFRALFEQIAGEDMEVSAEELKYVLDAVLQKKKDIQFKKLNLISCKNIFSLMDTSGNGKLEFDEFKVFWDKLKKWMNLFCQFDADKSGPMSSYELRIALKAAGFQLSNHLLQLMVLRYADEELQLGFDDFLNCLVRLENAGRVFQALSTKNKEFFHLNISEFINLTVNI